MTIPDTNAVISIIDDAIADSLGPDWNSFQAAHHVMQWLTDAGLQIVPQCSHGRVLAMDNAQVTQKDREAAARIYQNFRDHDYAKWILDGTNAMGDHDPVIQAFARHRLERSEPVPFQQGVDQWMDVCFGEEIKADRVERCDRFIEEALEFVQSVGYSAERAHALVEYVFNRDIGEVNQEVGGVMVTLAAACNTVGVDMQKARDARIPAKEPKP